MIKPLFQTTVGYLLRDSFRFHRCFGFPQVSEGIGGNGRSGGVKWPLATLGSAVAKHGSSNVAKERMAPKPNRGNDGQPLRGVSRESQKPEKLCLNRKISK